MLKAAGSTGWCVAVGLRGDLIQAESQLLEGFIHEAGRLGPIVEGDRRDATYEAESVVSAGRPRARVLEV